MLTEEQLEIISDTLSPLYQYLEAAVIADIARRVKKTMTYTRTAELQAIALRELGYSPAKIRVEVMKKLRADQEFQRLVEQNTLVYKQEVKELIKSITQQARAAGNEIVAGAGEMSWIDDMRVWEDAGGKLGTHSRLGQIVEAFQRQTAGELKNLTRSTGFKTMSGFESTENLYRMELDKALIKMSSGAFSSDQCVRDMVHELSQSGIRTIDYASGRSYQMDTAVRMCLRTAGNQTAAQVMNMNLKQTGVSLVQVSAHWGARNKGEGICNHEKWQGKVYSVDGKPHPEEEKRIGQEIRDLEEATGYNVHTGQGAIEGLHGVNCRHQHFVFFEGVDRPVKYPPQPQPKEVNGRTYDYYAMTQKQRRMEREIRALKREKEALKALGEDTKRVEARIRQKTAEYKQFSKECGINPKMNRLRVESGVSDVTKTQAWKAYKNVVNTSKPDILNVDKTKLRAEPNSITQEILKGGGVNRNYYDGAGKQIKQISNHNHGNAKRHPFGEKGEHAHDYIWEDDKLTGRPVREITEDERKENSDIL